MFTKTSEPEIQPVAVVASSCDPITGTLLCVAREEGDLVIETLDGTVVTRVPIPTVTVNAPTIRVTLPRVTVTRPPVTITLPRVSLAGPTVSLPGQTITVRLPRATETATIAGKTTTVRQPEATVTVVVPKPGQTIPGLTITSTAPNGQTTQTYVRISPSPISGETVTTPAVKERTIKVSIPQAIGYGLGILLIGLIIGLLAIFISYVVGYKDSEDQEKRNWAKFRKDMFGK